MDQLTRLISRKIRQYLPSSVRATANVSARVILSWIMMKNGQTYFPNLAAFTQQVFQHMFGHFYHDAWKGYYFNRSHHYDEI